MTNRTVASKAAKVRVTTRVETSQTTRDRRFKTKNTVKEVTRAIARAATSSMMQRMPSATKVEIRVRAIRPVEGS